jgi:hypothetical protein
MSDQSAVVMMDEFAEGDVLCDALRVICKPDESRGGVDDGAYQLAFAEILSIGESNKAILLETYKAKETVGAYVLEYNLKFPKRRDELLQGFIKTWLSSHPCEEFDGSSYRLLLIK